MAGRVISATLRDWQSASAAPMEAQVDNARSILQAGSTPALSTLFFLLYQRMFLNGNTLLFRMIPRQSVRIGADVG